MLFLKYKNLGFSFIKRHLWITTKNTIKGGVMRRHFRWKLVIPFFLLPSERNVLGVLPAAWKNPSKSQSAAPLLPFKAGLSPRFPSRGASPAFSFSCRFSVKSALRSPLTGSNAGASRFVDSESRCQGIRGEQVCGFPATGNLDHALWAVSTLRGENVNGVFNVHFTVTRPRGVTFVFLVDGQTGLIFFSFRHLPFSLLTAQ